MACLAHRHIDPSPRSDVRVCPTWSAYCCHLPRQLHASECSQFLSGKQTRVAPVSSDALSPKHGSCNRSLSWTPATSTRFFLVLCMCLLHAPACVYCCWCAYAHRVAIVLHMHAGTASVCACFPCLLIKTLATESTCCNICLKYVKYLKHTLATYGTSGWNTYNILLKQLKHFKHTLTIYVYRHCNICNFR
jgi:hypothetical protein